jgi:hypothetical protein
MLLWLRVIPDTVFIFAGAIPIVAASIWGLINLRAEKPIEQPSGELTDSKPAAAPVYRSRIQ